MKKGFMYSLLWNIIKIVARLYLGLEVIGVENIPKKGGVILAPNHPSDLDSFILGASINRQLNTMGKAELFRKPVIGKFFRMLGAFPVNRGAIDSEAIKVAVDRLKKGNVIDIYPEGTVSKDGALQLPKYGVGLIALMSQVPVIPVAIMGLCKVYPKGARFPKAHKVKIVFGKPLLFTEYYSSPFNKKNRVIITERIMQEIRRLLEVYS